MDREFEKQEGVLLSTKIGKGYGQTNDVPQSWCRMWETVHQLVMYLEALN